MADGELELSKSISGYFAFGDWKAGIILQQLGRTPSSIHKRGTKDRKLRVVVYDWNYLRLL